MSDLKTNVKNLPTNWSTYAALFIATMGYLGQTGAGSLDELIKNFSLPALCQYIAAFAAFLAVRVWPQNRDAP